MGYFYLLIKSTAKLLNQKSIFWEFLFFGILGIFLEWKKQDIKKTLKEISFRVLENIEKELFYYESNSSN